MGKTKAQVLKSIKGFDIGSVRASKLKSDDLVAFAKLLVADRQPQTVANYMSHLGSVIAVARPAWGYLIDPTAMKDALLVTNRLGFTSKSRSRDRRPSLEELDKLMNHYQAQQARHRTVIPMTKIIPFAIFSTRRQGEIVTIKWEDLDEKHSRILVRDMKNPGEKYGNDVWCDLTPEALKIIQSMPKVADEIFPFTTDAISASFLRTCNLLAIDVLTFHDLRHEGVSRLFEIGYNIPHAALVSGHRSWASLKRYTHIRQLGDKFKDWPWFPVVYGPIR